MLGPAAAISSRQMPASLGVQGPGESTMPFGFILMTSAAPILSLRNTSQAAPSSPRKWTRL
jgi:hypothetical protein